jgi:hypothetical protein
LPTEGKIATTDDCKTAGQREKNIAASPSDGKIGVISQGGIVQSVRNNVAVVMLALGMSGAASLPAQAQMSVERYGEILKTAKYGNAAEATLVWYLAGVRGAFDLLEWEYEDRKAPSLYCVPETSLVDLGEFKAMLEDEMKRQPQTARKNADQSVAMFAVEALRRQFPCK